MKIDNDFNWGSHLPMLMKIMSITKGDVLEMGMGLYSTPFLYWICKDQERRYVCYENNFEWYKKFWGYAKPEEMSVSTGSPDAPPLETGMISPLLEHWYVSDWDMAKIEKSWDVAFIDHAPSSRRVQDIKKVANSAQFVIVHDTQRNYKFCDYRKVWPMFKYRYDYTKAVPWTSVLSNFHDLSFLKEGE